MAPRRLKVPVIGSPARLSRCCRFHQAGAYVAILDRDAEALKNTWPDEARVSAHAVHVSDGDAVARVVDAVKDWSGSIDIAVNNAGITRDTVVWKMSDGQWRAVLDVHLGGTFAVTRAMVPVMRAAG